tara:strand:- start:9404 stop:10033 length:630 start_codon:yes stop_codon:yes gene_type:complete
VDYLNEDEQVEALKGWLKKYGTSIVTGVVLGIVIMYGIQYWKKHSVETSMQASILYEQMLNSLANGNKDDVSEQANTLKSDYAKTPYAGAASLLLAREAVYQGDLKAASEDLAWTIKNSKNPALRQVARLRQARVLSSLNDNQAALDVLSKVDDASYQMAIDGVSGDIYLAMDQKDKAEQRYQAALKIVPVNSSFRPILQMKLNNINGA